MSLVLEPFAVVLARGGHFLAQTISNAFKPLAIVDVGIGRSVLFCAQSALPVILIIQELTIISHLALSVKVKAGPVSLALTQVSTV